jgi:hypothetical protein
MLEKGDEVIITDFSRNWACPNCIDTLVRDGVPMEVTDPDYQTPRVADTTHAFLASPTRSGNGYYPHDSWYFDYERVKYRVVSSTTTGLLVIQTMAQ